MLLVFGRFDRAPHRSADRVPRPLSGKAFPEPPGSDPATLCEISQPSIRRGCRRHYPTARSCCWSLSPQHPAGPGDSHAGRLGTVVRSFAGESFFGHRVRFSAAIVFPGDPGCGDSIAWCSPLFVCEPQTCLIPLLQRGSVPRFSPPLSLDFNDAAHLLWMKLTVIGISPRPVERLGVHHSGTQLSRIP
jgi:hypothetical protein